MDKILLKLKNLSSKSWVIIAIVCVFMVAGTNRGGPAKQDIEDSGQFRYSTTIDDYPGVVISANSREELDKVIDILLHADIYGGSTTQTTPANQETQPATKATTPPAVQESAQDELNKTEKAIFDLLTKAVKKFPNPSSVKVVEFHAYQEHENKYYLTLTSENNFGGSLTDLYELDDDGAYGSSYSEKQLKDMRSILRITTPSCDVSKINKALDEYYAEQGWK